MSIVQLPGSGNWEAARKWGEELAAQFPDANGDDFAQALINNSDSGPLKDEPLVALSLLRGGENDRRSWVWLVRVGPEKISYQDEWLLVGWCDYTGWDCQSSVTWYGPI